MSNLAEASPPSSSGAPAPDAFTLRDKIVMLRYSRLGKIPSATYATQILFEENLSPLVVEIDPHSSQTTRKLLPYPRVRWGLQWTERFPRKIRSSLVIATGLIRLMVTIFREGKPRAIIAHGVFEQAYAHIVKMLFRVPYVVHVHEIHDPSRASGLMGWFVKYEKTALRGAKFLIVSESNRERLYRERYRFRCPSVIAYNTPRRRERVTDGEMRKKLGLSAKDFLTLYIGGLGKLNFVDHLVEAMALLPSDAHLILAGWMEDDFKTELAGLLEKHKLTGRVHVLGGSTEDKWTIIDSCDLAFCAYDPIEPRTQFVATASNKIMEAIAAGIPVLLNDTPHFREFLEEFAVGAVADANSPRAIARAIKSFMDDPVGRMVIKKRAFQLHQSQLNYEYQFRGALKLIKDHFFR